MHTNPSTRADSLMISKETYMSYNNAFQAGLNAASAQSASAKMLEVKKEASWQLGIKYSRSASGFLYIHEVIPGTPVTRARLLRSKPQWAKWNGWESGIGNGAGGFKVVCVTSLGQDRSVRWNISNNISDQLWLDIVREATSRSRKVEIEVEQEVKVQGDKKEVWTFSLLCLADSKEQDVLTNSFRSIRSSNHEDSYTNQSLLAQNHNSVDVDPNQTLLSQNLTMKSLSSCSTLHSSTNSEPSDRLNKRRRVPQVLTYKIVSDDLLRVVSEGVDPSSLPLFVLEDKLKSLLLSRLQDDIENARKKNEEERMIAKVKSEGYHQCPPLTEFAQEQALEESQKSLERIEIAIRESYRSRMVDEESSSNEPKSPSVLTVKVIGRDDHHLPPPPVTLQSPTASLTEAVTEDMHPQEETDSVAPQSDADEAATLDDTESVHAVIADLVFVQ
ncbi:hypothetical protein GUITHDRAFT_144623 [Guillardia theta CCMP2712]|uniref:Uncharacterized protein n=1 Tax=Guillardia theta (strain CCMP2712) TaxID=905079 RepID=L1INV3_GUITC|nr:hypothetical protein GUITHDRAFT_144623 [Guillardia theta CCMP2712]EKX37938.1 hypothetical protein GUITHDRAFT_144623 [Guillardia theta CCMP2712]|eukprot:XP_005824918.1 hypothetical protein GUITHDRAFT_144623 [Guillardia theta CCMP2712]